MPSTTLRGGGSRVPLRQFGLSLAVGFLLAFALPGLLVMSMPGIGPTVVGFLAWTLVAYSGARLGYLAGLGQMRVISITFWTYVYIWLGLCPFVEVSVGRFPWPGEYSEGLELFAIFIVWVGLIGYEVGSFLISRRHSLLSRVVSRLAERQITVRRTVIFSLGAIVLSVVMVQFLGGGRILFMARNARLDLLLALGGSLAGGSVMLTLMRVPSAVASLLLIYLWKTNLAHRRLRSKIWYFFLLAAVVVLNLAINNPIASARWWFGTVVIGMAILAVQWRGRLSSTGWILGFIAGLILLFPIADLFRYSTDAKLKFHSGLLPATQLVDSGDFSSYQQVMNGVKYVDLSGYGYGRQLMSALLVFVPRSVWSSKSVHTGELVATGVGYTWTNLEMPLWGEAYVDWGIPGVLLYFMFYGALSVGLERSALRSASIAQPVVFVMIAALSAFQLLFLRGSLGVALAFVYPLVAGILIPTTRRRWSPRPAARAPRARGPDL